MIGFDPFLGLLLGKRGATATTRFLRHCKYDGLIYLGIFDYIHTSDWEILSGTWSINKGALRVTYPGEIQYIGDAEVPPDAAIVLRFCNPDDMKLEIRGRKNGDDYVCFGLDFENQTIYLVKNEGSTRTVLKTESHPLGTTPKLFETGLWMYDDTIMGFINGAYCIGVTSSFNQTETGWSVYVPEIYENIITEFWPVSVYSLKAYPSEPTIPDDPANMYQQYRKKLKERVENPSEFTYDTFLYALTSWKDMRNWGATDEIWAELGYPIYPPLPENWH